MPHRTTARSSQRITDSPPPLLSKNQLHIDYTGKNAWDPEWYKDEGGKDKAMKLCVRLENAQGIVETGRAVPVTLRLMYSNGKPCRDQTIMKVLAGSKMEINPATGQTVIRVRIEEVSRNHQHQKFVIQVIPDVAIEPLVADVGGVSSPAVDVSCGTAGCNHFFVCKRGVLRAGAR